MNRMTTWVRPEIRALNAYQVADAEGLIKLDAMENPYPLPESIRKALAEQLADQPVNRYPDPEARKLNQALRKLWQVPDGIRLIFGNGSDELIQLLALVLGGPGQTIMGLEPSFVMYRMIATFTRSDYVGVTLTDDFNIDLPATLRAIQERQPALFFIACPNNPTGNLFDAEALAQIVKAVPGYVVIDEAYMAFTDADHLDWMTRYDNVLVMRTLSKVGLAGLRLGMLLGRDDIVREVNKVRLPYNINVLTQQAALVALEHFDVLQAQTRQLRQSREVMIQALNALPGVTAMDSEANFILARVPDAQAWFEALRSLGILVKCLHGAHPMLANTLRLTVGAEAENERLIQSLRELADG